MNPRRFALRSLFSLRGLAEIGCAVVPPTICPAAAIVGAIGSGARGDGAVAIGVTAGAFIVGAIPVGAVAAAADDVGPDAATSAGGTCAASVTFDGASPNIARLASRSASRIAAALAHRSDFSNASARSTTCAIAGGIAGATLTSERAGGVAARIISCAPLSPSCTTCPDRSVKSVAPAAHTSVCASISLDFAIACSGAMNAGVPRRIPVPVFPAPAASASRARAMPKSSTFTVPSRTRNRFAGLMSR